MLTVISPAKTLDYKTPLATQKFSEPDMLDQSEQLVNKLKSLSPPRIAKLMKLSDKLAALNFERYQEWQQPFTSDNARPAILAFKGDVYTGLEAENFSERDFDFAQDHLRILSGLYGVLKPLDLMQPYRLEMGTPLKVNRRKDLYHFWGDRITESLNQQLNQRNARTLVNLASQEYFKSVQPNKLAADVVTPVFKDLKSGKYKIISFFAKKARGQMSAWLIRNRIDQVEGIKAFDVDGYRYNAAESGADKLVFLRD